MACRFKTDCTLFERFTLQANLSLWKTRYCDNDKRCEECARYQLIKLSKPVPLNLLPNGKILGSR